MLTLSYQHYCISCSLPTYGNVDAVNQSDGKLFPDWFCMCNQQTYGKKLPFQENKVQENILWENRSIPSWICIHNQLVTSFRWEIPVHVLLVRPGSILDQEYKLIVISGFYVLIT